MSDPGVVRPVPTSEQLAALSVVGSSVALSAGAGCGKTFVLAERFVRALDGADARPLGRVVALTFTNKAARELRERIRQECRARLDSGDDPARWRAILRGLEAARIGTFHSSCGDLLRRFSIEAGVDPGFVVLDETIALSIREESLAATLRERLAARDPDLMELAVEFGLGMVRQSLDDLLGHRSVGDLGAWAGRQPRELVDAWVKLWTESVQPAMIAEFRRKAGPCLDLIAGNTFDHEKVRARLAELSGSLDRLRDVGDQASALEEIHGCLKVQGLPAKNWPSAEVYESIKGSFDKLRKEAKKLQAALPWDEPTTLIAARQGLMFARLADRAKEAYDLAKRSRGGIDNDDLLVLTRDLLADPSGSVREAVAGAIDLVLVDEFQDTDPVQSTILEALAGPGLLEGKLFLVGDFKQSIYRFRGARPGLFRDYRARFPEAGRLALSENFRSVPAILGFVNALFDDTFPEAGSALRPGVPSIEGQEVPAVEFLWGPSAEEESAAPKPDANARRREEARRLARHLKSRLDEGWMIRDRKDGKPRRADQGDVAFLFRSLSDSSDYEQALVAEGLDYHVVGGSGFFAQQEVLDLINVLTAVDDPLDAVSLAGALRSPFFSISDDALYWLSTDRKGFPHEGLERSEGANLDRLPEADRPRSERARRLFDEWRSVKDRLPIAALVDKILAGSGYEAALIGEFLGDRKRANARKLVRMARRFDEQGGFTLADFVARLRADLRGATKETQAATTDEDGEVIRLMSIHQAKGLEFPIVVLPDLDRKRPGELKRVAFDPELGPLVNPFVEPVDGEDPDDSGPSDSLGWSIHKHRERVADDEEALRLFYVAATRARDALVLSSATDPAKAPTSPALALLDRRFDRPTGLLKVPPPDGAKAPAVRVVDPPPSGPSVASKPRHRPRLLEVAAIIQEGASRLVPTTAKASPPPGFVDLDPSAHLTSTSARLDRLIRAILADPRSLDPGRVSSIAGRAARTQEPVSPSGLVREAIERVSTWARSPIAREIAKSVEVHRAFRWSSRWPSGGESTSFQGVGDFLYRKPAGGLALVILSDPTAADVREGLRLHLSAWAARAMGWGEVEQAWWVRLGPGGGLAGFDRFDDEAIDRAVRRFGEDPFATDGTRIKHGSEKDHSSG